MGGEAGDFLCLPNAAAAAAAGGSTAVSSVGFLVAEYSPGPASTQPASQAPLAGSANAS